jgi:hypothetical protein
MRVRTLVASIAVLGVLTTACANASEVPGSGSSGPGTIDHPTGSTDLLLRVSDEGGFVAPEYLLTAAPAFSLFGDGTVVTQGAQTEIYPGPALPPLIVTHVTEDGIQALLRAALEAGLDTDHQYTDMGAVGIADASTTVFTFTVDGVAHVTKVYALGMLTGDQPQGMSGAEFAARTHLGTFQGSLQDLRTTLPNGSVGDDAPFTPSGLRLFVTDYRAGDLKEPAVDWPLATPLSSRGDPSEHAGYACVAVTGADLDAVLPLAQSANQLTPWRSDGARFAVLFRPLLPDESGC